MTDKKETLEQWNLAAYLKGKETIIETGDFSTQGVERVLDILKRNFRVTVSTHGITLLKDPAAWELHVDAFCDSRRWEKLVIYDSEREILFWVKRDLMCKEEWEAIFN